MCSLCSTPELWVRRECLGLAGQDNARTGQAAGQNTALSPSWPRLEGWRAGQHSIVMTEQLRYTTLGLLLPSTSHTHFYTLVMGRGGQGVILKKLRNYWKCRLQSDRVATSNCLIFLRGLVLAVWVVMTILNCQVISLSCQPTVAVSPCHNNGYLGLDWSGTTHTIINLGQLNHLLLLLQQWNKITEFLSRGPRMAFKGKRSNLAESAEGKTLKHSY